MILEADNIELSFENLEVLKGIYIKIEKGKITGLLGNNGSGKSSLLAVLFGYLSPERKLIRINKKPHLRPLYSKNQAKYLPQHHFMPDDLKVYRAFKLFNVDWNKFVTLFPLLEKHKTDTFKLLSGGEKRIIEVYLIIKSKTNFVFLDEPFSHITPVYIETLIDIIHQEKKNKGILITDHMYAHIVNTSDFIFLIKNGCSIPINQLTQLEDYNYVNKL
ncbi:ABC-type cobalamin/Fe3+-siderophores transport system, ATPase component [Zhouia amylolytica]|uniref:ABC transporter domain-containing protein n=2 Tax=Zhouia amylolytica TaxID=376730 RepID=W2UMK9_9FLAO|nr:ABC transporter ATP-binding protein [Zhouia amylolytica]ETN95233.1 hypothetical protein P278_19880 [Zhouia amylolytica AD3]SFS67313.1 ABC-type cobalamin/Fe3+-siderophores transport system, ATPase component [Zhouia amylolytica]